MTPYFADDWLTVYQGDCREVMASMEPASVHCVVTSPPYWGLRDYGTASWIGGDAGCDHLGPPMRTNNKPSDPTATFHGGTSRGSEPWRVCGKCGAIREDNQLGLEPTPEEYVANMVGVFREVWRVLRDDGTVWLNLGDSYASGTVGRNDEDEANLRRRFEAYGTGRPKAGRGGNAGRSRPVVSGLKPKDLVGIPWRVAFALQADGWYLRSDIIWSKPNPMPESVTDRPTKSHEYLFLLSKSARYYFDADAVREPHVREWGENNGGTFGPVTAAGGKQRILGGTKDHKGAYPLPDPAGRNIRSVWTIATQPYPGAHFATFPPKLVEPCVKAGSPQKVCGTCGAPWERQTERIGGERYATGKSAAKNNAGLATAFSGYTDGSSAPSFVTTGWRATCAHEGPTTSGVVLDPFGGSGTTGMVAQHLGRRAVLIDLNGDYLVQAMRRNQQAPLGLGDTDAA